MQEQGAFLPLGDAAIVTRKRFHFCFCMWVGVFGSVLSSSLDLKALEENTEQQK